MAIIKKPYELVIWDEKLDFNNDGNDIKKELRNYTIGSDTMTYPGRATNVQLKRELKGTNTLTFQMPTKFFNSKTGKFEKNEMIDDVFNERKLKLHYDGKWYEFYVKKITEEKKYKAIMKSFECTDSFIEELSRTGYDIEFSEDKYNSVQEAGDFMNDILEDSVWDYTPEYNTGDFTEYNEEMFYKIPLNQFGGKLFGYEIKLDVDESDFKDTSTYYKKVEERDGEGTFNREMESKIYDIYSNRNRQLQYGDDLSREKELFFDPYIAENVKDANDTVIATSEADNGHDLLSSEKTNISGDYIYVPMSDLAMVMGSVYKQTREAQETPALYGAYDDSTKDWYQHYALCPKSKNPKDYIQFVWFKDKDEVKIDEGNVICNMDHHYLISIEDWNSCLAQAHNDNASCNSLNVYWTATKVDSNTSTLYYTYGDNTDNYGTDNDTVYTKGITTASLVNDDFDWNPVYYENYLTNIGSTEATQARKISITDRTELDMGKIEKEDWEGNKDEDDKTYATIYKTSSDNFQDQEYTEPELTGGVKAPQYYYDDPTILDDNGNEKKETTAEFQARESTGKEALKSNGKQFRVMSKLSTREIVPKLATNLVSNAEQITSTSGWEVRQYKDPDDSNGNNTGSQYQTATLEAQNVLQDEMTATYSESGKLTEDTSKETIAEQDNTTGTTIDEQVYDYYLEIDSPYYTKTDNFSKEGMVCSDYILNFGLSSQKKKIEKDKVYAIQMQSGRDYIYSYDIKFRNTCPIGDTDLTAYTTESDDLNGSSFFEFYPPLPDTYAGLSEDEIADIESSTGDNTDYYKGKSKKWRENYVNTVITKYKQQIHNYMDMFRQWGTKEGYTFKESLLSGDETNGKMTISVYDFFVGDSGIVAAIKKRKAALFISSNPSKVGNVDFDKLNAGIKIDAGNDFRTLQDRLNTGAAIYSKLKANNTENTYPAVTKAHIDDIDVTLSITIHKPESFAGGNKRNAVMDNLTNVRYCPYVIEYGDFFIIINAYPFATVALNNSDGNPCVTSTDYQVLLSDSQIKKYMKEVIKLDSDIDANTIMTNDAASNTISLSGESNVSINVNKIVYKVIKKDKASDTNTTYEISNYADIGTSTDTVDNTKDMKTNNYVPTEFQFGSALSSYNILLREIERMEYYGTSGRGILSQQNFYLNGEEITIDNIKHRISNDICYRLTTQYNDYNTNHTDNGNAENDYNKLVKWNSETGGSENPDIVEVTPYYRYYQVKGVAAEKNKIDEAKQLLISAGFDILLPVANMYLYPYVASDTTTDTEKTDNTTDTKTSANLIVKADTSTTTTDKKNDKTDDQTTQKTTTNSTIETSFYGGTADNSDIQYALYYVKQLDIQTGNPMFDWDKITVKAPNEKEEQNIIDACIVPKTRFKKKYNIDLDHIIIGEGSIDSNGNYTIQGAIDNLNNDPDKFISFRNLFEKVDDPNNYLYFVPEPMKIENDEIVDDEQITGIPILGIDGDNIPVSTQVGYLTHSLYRTREADTNETLTSYYKGKKKWYWRRRVKSTTDDDKKELKGCNKLDDTYISIKDETFLLFKAKRTINNPYIGIYIESKPIELKIDGVKKNIYGYSQKGLKLDVLSPVTTTINSSSSDDDNTVAVTGQALPYYGIDNVTVTLYWINTDNGFSQEYCDSLSIDSSTGAINADDQTIQSTSSAASGRSFGELQDGDFNKESAKVYYTYTSSLSDDVIINNFDKSGADDKSYPYAIFIKANGLAEEIYMGVCWVQRK